MPTTILVFSPLELDFILPENAHQLHQVKSLLHRNSKAAKQVRAYYAERKAEHDQQRQLAQETQIETSKPLDQASIFDNLIKLSPAARMEMDLFVDGPSLHAPVLEPWNDAPSVKDTQLQDKRAEASTARLPEHHESWLIYPAEPASFLDDDVWHKYNATLAAQYRAQGNIEQAEWYESLLPDHLSAGPNARRLSRRT